MGWSIGYDSTWERDIGYGVPAYCDHPGCEAEIDRGLAHVCGGEPYGGDEGCGLYFCGAHLSGYPQQCERCVLPNYNPFTPSVEHPDWIKHKLTDPSWQEWRDIPMTHEKRLSLCNHRASRELPKHESQ